MIKDDASPEWGDHPSCRPACSGYAHFRAVPSPYFTKEGSEQHPSRIDILSLEGSLTPWSAVLWWLSGASWPFHVQIGHVTQGQGFFFFL